MKFSTPSTPSAAGFLSALFLFRNLRQGFAAALLFATLAADAVQVSYHFTGAGGDPSDPLTLSGWISCDSELAPTASDTTAGTATYRVGGAGITRGVVSFVITDSSGTLLWDGTTPDYADITLHADATSTRFTVTGQCPNPKIPVFPVVFAFSVEADSLQNPDPVAALRLPLLPPGGSVMTWTIGDSRRPGIMSGSYLVFRTNEEVDATILTLSAQITQLTRSLKVDSAQLQLDAREIAHLNQQLQVQTDAVAAAETQVAQLQADLAQANANLQTDRAILRNQQEEIARLAAKLEASTNALDAARAQLAQLQSDFTQANAALAEMKATIKGQVDEIGKLGAELQKAQAQSIMLAENLEITQRQLAASDAQRLQLARDFQEADALAQWRGRQLDQLHQQLAETNASLAAANAALVDLQAQAVQWQTERVALLRRIQAAESSAFRYQQEAAQLYQERTALQARVDVLGTALVNFGAALAASVKKPAIAIPGKTPEEQLAALSAAILNLEQESRKDLWKQLTAPKSNGSHSDREGDHGRD